MKMATKTRRWTRADLERLPDDGNRYEVLDGELFVTPQAAFDHQFIALELATALRTYCNCYDLGVVVGPGAVVFGKNELQPDVHVVPGPRPPRGTKWAELPIPLLVAEVLSDSTGGRDLGKKREAYLRINIPTYWVVDADERRVFVWTRSSPEPVTVSDVLRWQPRGDLPPLEISLETLFGVATA